MDIASDLKRACFATKCFLLAFGFAFSSLAAMIPYAKNRLEVDDAQLGVILLFSGIGGLISMPVAGLLIRRFGTQAISFWAGMAIVAILPLISVISSPILFTFVLLLFGIGTGTLNVAINSHAVNVEKKANTPLMSGFHCLFSSGGLLGAVLVGSLLKLGCSLFVAILIVSFTIGFILVAQGKKLLPKNAEFRACEERQKLSWPEGKVFLLGFICFIAFMSEGSMLDWSAEFLHSELGYELSVAGIGYALFSISMAVGRLIGDYLNRNFGTIAVFQAGSVVAATGFFLTFFLHIPYVALVGFCLIGLGASNLVPIVFTASGRVERTPSSISLAIVTSIGYMGALFGPAFVGFLAQATTLSFALTCIGLGIAFLGLCGSVIRTESIKVTATT